VRRALREEETADANTPARGPEAPPVAYGVTSSGQFAVHLWMERLGATSATAGYRVCATDGLLTHGHGTRTVVRLDRTTLRPTRWSDRIRELSDRIAGPARP
jgi:hypothetical protein